MAGLLNRMKHVTSGFLLTLTLVASYGCLFPWPAGEQALRRYPGQTPIMVAEFYHSESWRDRTHDWVTSRSETRSYILVPSVFRIPRIVTVSQDNDEAPIVSELRVPFILLVLAGMIALGALGVWYLSMRPPSAYRLSAEEARTIYEPRLPQK
jgi:hypothetical protein